MGVLCTHNLAGRELVRLSFQDAKCIFLVGCSMPAPLYDFELFGWLTYLSVLVSYNQTRIAYATLAFVC